MKTNLLVYLADDHTLVRKGMARFVRTFARVGEVREASNGQELLNMVKDQLPDAVILDIEMPVMNGVETAAQLAAHYPQVKILVLTMHAEESFVLRLLDVGVHGYLSKTTEPEEVERALYAVVDRDFYKNDIIARALQRHSGTHKVITAELTDRETEVLLLICRELMPKEISSQLGISEKTFFNHRANILAKTRSRTNVGLVKFAYQKGLIQV